MNIAYLGEYPMPTVVKQVRAQREWFRSLQGETHMYGFDLTLLGHMVRSSSYIYGRFSK